MTVYVAGSATAAPSGDEAIEARTESAVAFPPIASNPGEDYIIDLTVAAATLSALEYSTSDIAPFRKRSGNCPPGLRRLRRQAATWRQGREFANSLQFGHSVFGTAPLESGKIRQRKSEVGSFVLFGRSAERRFYAVAEVVDALRRLWSQWASSRHAAVRVRAAPGLLSLPQRQPVSGRRQPLLLAAHAGSSVALSGVAAVLRLPESRSSVGTVPASASAPSSRAAAEPTAGPATCSPAHTTPRARRHSSSNVGDGRRSENRHRGRRAAHRDGGRQASSPLTPTTYPGSPRGPLSTFLRVKLRLRRRLRRFSPAARGPLGRPKRRADVRQSVPGSRVSQRRPRQDHRRTLDLRSPAIADGGAER